MSAEDSCGARVEWRIGEGSKRIDKVVTSSRGFDRISEMGGRESFAIGSPM